MAKQEALRVAEAVKNADWKKTGEGLLEEQRKAREAIQALWDEAMNDKAAKHLPDGTFAAAMEELHWAFG